MVQLPAARIRLEGVAQWRCHRIAHELDKIGAFTFDRIENLLGVEGPAFIQDKGETI